MYTAQLLRKLGADKREGGRKRTRDREREREREGEREGEKEGEREREHDTEIKKEKHVTEMEFFVGNGFTHPPCALNPTVRLTYLVPCGDAAVW